VIRQGQGDECGVSITVVSFLASGVLVLSLFGWGVHQASSSKRLSVGWSVAVRKIWSGDLASSTWSNLHYVYP
jgi:hypothetical protein